MRRWLRDVLCGVSLLVCLFGVSSCGSVKDITYLQSNGLYSKTALLDTFELRIRPDDRLEIRVSCLDEELTKPFNIQTTSGGGSSGYNNNYNSGYQNSTGFLVDKNGYINYPIFGRLKVMGQKRRELEDMLQNKLSQGGYIKDPIVMVRFSNFRITLLGEVSRPGVYYIDKERINLFEALGQGGDLNIYGRRDRVAVIREEGGERTILYHDLRSLDVMQSPFFYLKQNDIIYVEPNRVRAEASAQNQFTSVGTWISLISFLSTMGVLIFK